MTNSEAPPSQGLVAGKYELVRKIGRGGMGSVWEARHASLGTSSAIKFIEAEYADSQEARSRFDKEAKAAATIQSKHAIQIYDHGVTEDGRPYIVMELLQGEALDKRLERAGRMSLQETAKVLHQVCRGLARAHDRGIIHRDLKPENIFLVRGPDDDDEVAKVLDFGIAKMSGSPGNSGITSGTKTGAILGTPFYMSPEQARGLKNVDHRTDVWSLGVIAYRCVCGELPFDGESVGDLLVKICTAPPPVPSRVLPELPPNFDAWFMRALEREPERRFSNVTELSDALCFAAGIATRSMPGAPLAHVGSMNSSRSSEPNAAQGLYAPAPPLDHTMPGPAHGAMTNAPFTSEQVPGVPSGNGKLVAGGLFAGSLAIAATVGIVFFLKASPSDAPQAAAIGIVASPPASVVAPTPPTTTESQPLEPPSPAPPLSATPLPTATVAKPGKLTT
ncbi:MAG TPA: protein kinase, partial [Labilithrix sp.]|nr:protein kinase [Labilithrix sp.]